MRLCPFPFCSNAIVDEQFACVHHWELMPVINRRFAEELIKRMANHFICCEQFEEESREIIARCPGAFFGSYGPFS